MNVESDYYHNLLTDSSFIRNNRSEAFPTCSTKFLLSQISLRYCFCEQQKTHAPFISHLLYSESTDHSHGPSNRHMVQHQRAGRPRDLVFIIRSSPES